MKTLVISVIIAMTSVVNAAADNRVNQFAYNTETNEGRVQTQTVFKVENNKYLHNHVKYNYIYDKAGRVSRKEVLKWNENTQRFENHHSLNFFYSDEVTIEYALWNEKDSAYSNIKEKAVYQLNDGTMRYLSYEWNEKANEWKLDTEHDAIYWGESLLASK